MPATQQARIKIHLKVYGSITPIEALTEYGCFRLASVIYRLRKKRKNGESGMVIDTEGAEKYAVYTLRKKDQRQFKF